MSGGSFNYLYAQWPYQEDELRNMAAELRRRGMYDAEAETLALIPESASEELAKLWHAIEWHVSADWSEAHVARAFARYETAKNEAA